MSPHKRQAGFSGLAHGEHVWKMPLSSGRVSALPSYFLPFDLMTFHRLPAEIHFKNIFFYENVYLK